MKSTPTAIPCRQHGGEWPVIRVFVDTFGQRHAAAICGKPGMARHEFTRPIPPAPKPHKPEESK